MNNCLGGDDGKLAPEDLISIGINSEKLSLGNGFIAIGKVGAKPNTSYLKVFNENKLKGDTIFVKKTLSSGLEISAGLDKAKHQLWIKVNEEVF